MTVLKKIQLRQFTEGVYYGLVLVHIEEHSLESDIHLSMNLLGNRHGDRIAGLNTGEPSSQTLHSTFPHCPKACKLQSMSWDTPVIRTNIEMEFLNYILSIAMR